MAARRALLETDIALDDPNLAPFQHQPARRGAVEMTADEFPVSVSARRTARAAIGFEPDEPLTATRRLPRITDEKITAPAVRGNTLKLRRGLLGVAAAATAGAVKRACAAYRGS